MLSLLPSRPSCCSSASKQGIMAAIVLSLLDHVRQGYRPHTAIILTDPVEHWRMEPVVPGRMIEPGLVMYWFVRRALLRECELFLRASVASGYPFTVARTMARGRCGGHCRRRLFGRQDAQGATVVNARREASHLVLTRVSESLRADLDRQQLTDAIGVHRIFGSRRDCLAAYQSRDAEETAEAATNPAGADPP